MRALAAWMVAIGHIGSFSAGASGQSSYFVHLKSTTDTMAHAGVDVFFVISGAIMFIIASGRNHRSIVLESTDFMVRRFLRIFPLFWLTFVVSLVTVGGQYPKNLTDWLRCLTLIDWPPTLPVAWTLVFEVRFYLMVAGLIVLFRRNLGAGFALWALGLVAAVFLTQYAVLPETWTAHPLMVEFIFGVGVGALYTYGISIHPRTLVVCGILWLLCTAIFVYPNQSLKVNDFRILGYGFPAAMILYGMISLERSNAISIPKALVKAGDASYSVYLWHAALITPIYKAWSGHGVWGGAGFIVSMLIVTALVSQVSFNIIERPLMRLARWVVWSIRSMSPAEPQAPTFIQRA